MLGAVLQYPLLSSGDDKGFGAPFSLLHLIPRHRLTLLVAAACLFSTHDLATAESVCHRIGILHRGRLLAEGSAAKLRQLAVALDLELVFLALTSDQAEQIVL